MKAAMTATARKLLGRILLRKRYKRFVAAMRNSCFSKCAVIALLQCGKAASRPSSPTILNGHGWGNSGYLGEMLACRGEPSGTGILTPVGYPLSYQLRRGRCVMVRP